MKTDEAEAERAVPCSGDDDDDDDDDDDVDDDDDDDEAAVVGGEWSRCARSYSVSSWMSCLSLRAWATSRGVCLLL